MRWIVDGSNVLGALGWDRESRTSKERLTSLCARFARHERKRLVLCFDGSKPSGFAAKLGAVSLRFCSPRSADDVIESATRDTSDSWSVVTSDAGIANRVRRRTVEVDSAGEFVRRLEQIPETDERDSDRTSGGEDEWQAYFSDPKNRMF